MLTDNAKQNSLLDRMETIEKQTLQLRKENRALKMLLMAATAGFCVVLMLGAAAVRKDANLGKISATRLAIVDEGGRELAILGQGENGTGLQVLTAAGKKGVALGIGKDGQSAGLAVFDGQEKPRIGLGMKEAVPSLAITDAAGKKLVALGAGAERYGIAVFDANEVIRGALAMGPKGPLCCLSDDKGAPQAGMSQIADGSYVLSTIDKTGIEHAVN
jgi:hypothetical protein